MSGKQPLEAHVTKTTKKRNQPVVAGGESPADGPAAKKIARTASKIRKLHNDASAKELAARYEIAKLVAATQADASYGEKALDLLADELEDVGLSSKTLANYALVAKVFSREKFDELTKCRGGSREKPTQLTWTHLVTLAGKAKGGGQLNAGNIDRIVSLTLDEGLSDRQMAAKWLELYEPARSPAIGGPEDLTSGVHRMLQLVRRVLAQEAAFNSHELAKLEAGEPLPEPHLRDLVKELQALADFASTAHQRVSSVLKSSVPSAASVPEALRGAAESNLPVPGGSSRRPDPSVLAFARTRLEVAAGPSKLNTLSEG